MEGIHQVQGSTRLDLAIVAIHSKEAMVVLPMEVEVEVEEGDTTNALTEGGEEEASAVGQEGDVDQAMKEERGEGVGDSMNSRSQIQVCIIRKEMPIDSNNGRTSVYYVPYLLDQTPWLLFISSRNFVRLLFESGVY